MSIDALELPCPKCKVIPGYPCVNESGRETDVHSSRVRKANGYASRMAKRGYSREFKPHGDTGKRYLLDKIPAGLWAAVKDKCKREGVSVRAQILKLLKDWSAHE